MSLREDDVLDEQFSCILAAYDDALAAGRSMAPGDNLMQINPEWFSALHAAQACLRLLEQKWPRSPQRVPGEISLAPHSLFWGGVPRELGRFQLQRKLGEGGHGIVFLAFDSVLRRPVALKLPRPDTLLTPAVRRRFLREAQACAALTHPNLIAVYDAGEAGPLCYIAEAYCEGPTLSAWLKQQNRPLDPLLAAEIVRTLADSVAYAHRCGIVHRDLKPGNVLLEPKPSSGPIELAGRGGSASVTNDDFNFTLKLADFGLAKLADSDATQTDTVTFVGTVPYMAPEQARGRREEIGPRTDIYALGVTLFELLVRKKPFEGETAADTLRRIVADEPAPLRRLRPDVPADLEAICSKCLEKSPANRYATADALAEDLSRFHNGCPTQARPLGRLHRGLKWSRRRPAIAVVVLISALAVVGFMAGGWWHAATLQTALTVTQRMRREADSQRLEADAQREAGLKQQAIAQDREQRVRQYLYAADIRLAFAAWKNGRLKEAFDLLSKHVPTSDESDRRSFAWYYLWRLCNSELLTLRGHTGRVYGVAYSPDGKLLATTSADGTAKLWDALAGRELATLKGHVGGDVNAVAFAPDGKSFATSGDDRTVRIWDTQTRLLRATCATHAGDVLTVAFSTVGKTLASGGVDRLIKLWDPDSGRELATLRGHDGWIRGLAFSHDGNRLASASSDGTARVWDLNTGKVQTTFNGHFIPNATAKSVYQGSHVFTVAFAHDGRSVASGDERKQVKIWDPVTGMQQASFTSHSDVIRRVEFSRDDRTLMAAAHDGTVSLWDVATGSVKASIRGHTDKLWFAALSPDARTLATASGDRTVKVWDVDTRQERRTFAEIPSPVVCMAFSSDGKQLVSIDRNEKGQAANRTTSFRVWNFGTGKERPEFRRNGQGATLLLTTNARSVAISADRQPSDLSGDHAFDCAVAEQWRFKRFEIPSTDRVQRVALSCDGRSLANTDELGNVSLWDLASGKQRARMEFALRDTTSALEFDPDGKLLAAADVHGVVEIWNVAARTKQARLAGHGATVSAICFTSDGSTLATVGSDRTIKLWNLATAAELATLVGHTDTVRCVAFSPDGKTLASGGDDATVRLWDIRTSQELGSLDAHHGSVQTIAFSPNGQILASGGATKDNKGEIFYWSAADERR